jgi:predicted alpha/beta hydrolase family esterase
MTKQIVIVHGTCGSPEGNWFPWMKAQLEEKGHQVFVPEFPTPDNQSYSSWREIFYGLNIQPQNAILVGHSVGSPFVIRLTAESKTPYKAVFAIAPFIARLGLPDFDKLNASFVDPSVDWQRATRGASKRLCFCGSNDPYVPHALSVDFADKWQSELRTVPNGGHLNAESGFYQFPDLLGEIA